MKVWLVFFCSLLSGALGAMGLGGGGILLLALMALGTPQETACGINLLMIIPVGLLGLWFHRKNGLVRRQAVLPLLAGGVPGVLLGLFLSEKLSGEWLRRSFGILVIVLGARELVFGVKTLKKEGLRLLK